MKDRIGITLLTIMGVLLAFSFILSIQGCITKEKDFETRLKTLEKDFDKIKAEISVKPDRETGFDSYNPIPTESPSPQVTPKTGANEGRRRGEFPTESDLEEDRISEIMAKKMAEDVVERFIKESKK